MVSPSQLGYSLPGAGGGMAMNHGMRNFVQPWARPQAQQQEQQPIVPNDGRWLNPQLPDLRTPEKLWQWMSSAIPDPPENQLPYDWQILTGGGEWMNAPLPDLRTDQQLWQWMRPQLNQEWQEPEGYGDYINPYLYQ